MKHNLPLPFTQACLEYSKKVALVGTALLLSCASAQAANISHEEIKPQSEIIHTSDPLEVLDILADKLQQQNENNPLTLEEVQKIEKGYMTAAIQTSNDSPLSDVTIRNSEDIHEPHGRRTASFTNILADNGSDENIAVLPNAVGDSIRKTKKLYESVVKYYPEDEGTVVANISSEETLVLQDVLRAVYEKSDFVNVSAGAKWATMSQDNSKMWNKAYDDTDLAV